MKIGVVIVNHNLKDSLRETLASLRAVRFDGPIVVADNASTDGSKEMVKNEFPCVHLLNFVDELGYASAATQGMMWLINQGVDYIFSTTNDVVFEPNLFNELADYALANPDVGAIGCKIFQYGTNRIWHAGGIVNPVIGHARNFGQCCKDHWRYDMSWEPDFVTGCGIFLKVSALHKVGFYEGRLGFYFEDADLCYRIRKAGYYVVFLPSAVMWHKVGTTMRRNRPLQLRYATRNGLWFLREHGYRLAYWVNLFVVCPAKATLFLCMGRKANAIGIFRGVQDWFNKRFGLLVCGTRP